MRLHNQNSSIDDDSPNIGSLLIAHPSMLDPNFHQTVVFLAAHDPSEGSLGVIMNRPTNTTVGESDPILSNSAIADIPLYEGGPVARDKLILAAWKWVHEVSTFQLFFGIDESKAERLLEENSGFQLRGFMGYSGWNEGQLVEEVEQGTWLVSRSLPELIQGESDAIWRGMVVQQGPLMRLLVNAPDDPSLN